MLDPGPFAESLSTAERAAGSDSSGKGVMWFLDEPCMRRGSRRGCAQGVVTGPSTTREPMDVLQGEGADTVPQRSRTPATGNMSRAVCDSGVRGRRSDATAVLWLGVRPDDLAAVAIRAAVERSGVFDQAEIEDVAGSGMCEPGGRGQTATSPGWLRFVVWIRRTPRPRRRDRQPARAPLV